MNSASGRSKRKKQPVFTTVYQFMIYRGHMHAISMFMFSICDTGTVPKSGTILALFREKSFRPNDTNLYPFLILRRLHTDFYLSPYFENIENSMVKQFEKNLKIECSTVSIFEAQKLKVQRFINFLFKNKIKIGS